MNYTPFQEDFEAAEDRRNQIICDILFAPDPPSIDNIIECIPKPSTRANSRTWTNNYMLWDTWSVGTLNKAWEIRIGENKSGWGSQGAHQRGMLEYQVYNVIKSQTEQIKIMENKINELTNMMDSILVKQTKIKDEWVDIEDNVNMI